VLLINRLHSTIAIRAIDHCADALRALCIVLDPRSVLPRRTMPHVLRMTAAQLGDPVTCFVPVKA